MRGLLRQPTQTGLKIQRLRI